MTEASEPAPAKRGGLFKRPKWAVGGNTKASKSSTPKQNEDNDFFSRSNETFATFAKQEEEREKRRLARRAAQSKAKSATSGDDDSRPSSKRRRLSAESSGDGDDGEWLSDIEAERMEEEAEAAKAAQDATKTDFTDLLDKGKAFVKDGMEQMGMSKEDRSSSSPGKLPSPTSRIPNDEQCDYIRQRQPKLADYDNKYIRRLALMKWEQRDEESKSQSPTSETPSRQTRSSARLNAGSKNIDMPIRASPSRASPTRNKKPEIISLSDDDEDGPTGTSAVRPTSAALQPFAPVRSPTEPTEDPELLEIKRRAQEAAQRKRPLEESTAPQAPGSKPPTGTPGIGVGSGKTPPAPAPDPKVQLLVTSNIPNTRPLIIHRQISQRFKEVREYWCHTMEIPEETRPKVLLYWKRRRLYDSQTCTSLGFAAGPDGEVIYTKGNDDFFDDYEGKLNFVASMDGPPDSGRNAAPNRSPSQPASQTSQNAQPASSVAPEEEYRVTIRAKSYPEHKLIVKTSTVIERLIRAFRKHGKIPEDKKIVLIVDGELLQPNSTVGQTEIGDLEFIDAHVR